MMKKVIIITALFAAALFASICFYNPDRNVIDEDYILSKEYQSLEKQFGENKTGNRDKESILSLVAREILADTIKYNHPLPWHIDSLAIESIMGAKNKIHLNNSEVGQTEFGSYDFYGVLTLAEDNISVVLFLMKRPGVYKDIDVVLASVEDSLIVDIKSIGRYEKNIEEETTSTIQIDENQSIKTKTVKIRSYPVRQKNIIHYSYTVSNDGIIEVSVTSNN